MKNTYFIAVLLLLANTMFAQAADIDKGREVVNISCLACHKTGVMAAPKVGDTKDWKQRSEKGLAQLTTNAIKGLNNMPAKGGNYALSDQDIKDAISYFLHAAKVTIKAKPKKAKVKPKPKAKPKPKPVVKVTPVVKATPIAKVQKSAKKAVKSGAMRFNRLMKPPSEWNPPPFEDGIHDPDGEGAYALQAPREAFSELNKSNSGNRIDWVKSLNNGKIFPRYDRIDATKKPFVMDLNIVREVKGSMPNVVYPHKQHTQWLDCSNCHPDIFIPKKGANQISMASILMGEKCGVCHGKVAFPVSDCRKCHSQKKKKALVKSRKK